MTPKYITISEFCLRNPRYSGMARSICARINNMSSEEVRRYTYPKAAATYHPDDLLRIAQQLIPPSSEDAAPAHTTVSIERSRALYSKQLSAAVTSMLRICINDCLATPEPDKLADTSTALSAAHSALQLAIANMQSILRLEQQ